MGRSPMRKKSLSIDKHLIENENDLDIVKRLSGITGRRRISVSEVGWTSRTYIIDNGKIIFKFPRNKKFRRECRKEVAVLRLLKKHTFSVSTPILNWTTDDNAYFGFYGVEGKPLGDVIHTLTDEQKIDIGTQLGGFLKQLHRMTIRCGKR
jgi:predicted Ser/Thr protein kinase